MAAAAPALMIMQGAAGLLSAGASYKSGQAAKKEAKIQKQVEQLNAEERELFRQRELNAALASQVVQAGAGGIKLEGTPLAILEADSAAAKRESEADKLATDMRIRSIELQGKTAARMGRTQAFATLLNTGADVVETGWVKKA